MTFKLPVTILFLINLGIILIIILAFIMVILGWILVAPIQLIIDTDENIFMFRIVTIGSAAIVFEGSTFVLQLRSYFISRNIPLVKSRGKNNERKIDHYKDEDKGDKKTRKSSRKKNRSKWMFRLIRLPFSLRIRKFEVNMDTGDYIFNAYMFPVFGLINYYRPQWSWNINYFGRNQVSLRLQTTLIRMIYVYLK